MPTEDVQRRDYCGGNKAADVADANRVDASCTVRTASHYHWHRPTQSSIGVETDFSLLTLITSLEGTVTCMRYYVLLISAAQGYCFLVGTSSTK